MAEAQTTPVPPCALVIFGANGDLTKRKLMPAFYRLAYEGRLPAEFRIIGNSRTPLSDDHFRDKMRARVPGFLENSHFDEDVWRDFAAKISYVTGDVDDPNTFDELKRRLPDGNTLFYLSIQPSLYETAIEGIKRAGLHQGNGWRRIVVEKPFGHDVASGRQLNDKLHEVFPEHEVYRIDHYLGKETVQNILAFRFGNGIFEPLWNRRYVNHIQITAAETIGVEGRGAFYQEVGALRDMLQNHLLQIMATIAMEPPARLRADAVRGERAKLLRSVHIMKPEEVDRRAVAGQYGPAEVNGRRVTGFREEPGVDPQAQTDTYAAATFYIDNWRWADVPFYIRTGKRLPKRLTEIAVQFNPAPHSPFEGLTCDPPDHCAPNLMVLRIQPEEGISLHFLSKYPGGGMNLRPVRMDFNYMDSFNERLPSAYETLLLDAMLGDPTLYTRQDMVDISWQVVQPILDRWAEKPHDFPNYASGSWGPKQSDEMLARRGHAWRNL